MAKTKRKAKYHDDLTALIDVKLQYLRDHRKTKTHSKDVYDNIEKGLRDMRRAAAKLCCDDEQSCL